MSESKPLFDDPSGTNPKQPMEEDMADPTPPDVSPTGQPIIPPKYVPHALALLSVLGGVAALPTMGISLLPVAVTNWAFVATLIIAPLVGAASPGWRRK